jgi:hypothetical protein
MKNHWIMTLKANGRLTSRAVSLPLIGKKACDRQKCLCWTKFGTAALGAVVPSSLKSVHRATSLAQNWT